MKLAEWNAARCVPYEQWEQVPGEPGWQRPVRHDPPTPTPDEMPECECGAKLADTEPGWMLTSGIPKAWVHCPACGRSGMLRIW